MFSILKKIDFLNVLPILILGQIARRRKRGRQRIRWLDGITDPMDMSLSKFQEVEKAMAPHSSILAWKIHGQRSLVGCSPWGR